MHGLQESLLSKDELSKEAPTGSDDASDIESSHQEKPVSILGSTAVCMLAAAGCKFRLCYSCINHNKDLQTMTSLCLVAASAAAMVSVQAIMVFVAGGLCCLNAPAIIHKHFAISRSTGEF